MKGQLSTPEQRGTVIIMHSHKFEMGTDHRGLPVMKRVLKVVPGIGTEVTASDGKRKYIVGPRGNLIRWPGTDRKEN